MWHAYTCQFIPLLIHANILAFWVVTNIPNLNTIGPIVAKIKQGVVFLASRVKYFITNIYFRKEL